MAVSLNDGVILRDFGMVSWVGVANLRAVLNKMPNNIEDVIYNGIWVKNKVPEYLHEVSLLT